jgi:hypothetical protein
VHVADFGAVPDDGVDDLAAFTAAFAAAQERTVALVRASGGRYDLSRTLEVPHAVRQLELRPTPSLRGTAPSRC